jgi:hypothetical protein
MESQTQCHVPSSRSPKKNPRFTSWAEQAGAVSPDVPDIRHLMVRHRAGGILALARWPITAPATTFIANSLKDQRLAPEEETTASPHPDCGKCAGRRRLGHSPVHRTRRHHRWLRHPLPAAGLRLGVTPAMMADGDAGAAGRGDLASLAAKPALHTQQAAVKLTGLSEDTLRKVPAANIRGGASLLASYQKQVTRCHQSPHFGGTSESRRRTGPRRSGRRAGHRRAAAAGPPARPATRRESRANTVGVRALVAGQDAEPAEDSDGRDGRWRITPAHRPEPDSPDRRSGSPACPQDPHPPAGRFQWLRWPRSLNNGVTSTRSQVLAGTVMFPC